MSSPPLVPRASDPEPHGRLPRSPNPRLSRRTLLRGGATAGLVAAAGLAVRPAVAVALMPEPTSTGGHLVTDYQPSQPTGWPWTPGRSFDSTVGGHITAVDFTFNDRPCRVSVLESGAPGDAFAPRYEDRPADPDVGFADILADTSGAYYAFRYLGGFPGRAELRVRSYSAFATPDGDGSRFGADIHVVYVPDRAHGDPPADDFMHWIQVVSRRDPIGSGTELDNSHRANPFYIYGGLTSVNGDLVVNFQDSPQTHVQAPPSPDGSPSEAPLGEHRFLAETFLARDTGRRDGTGRGIVEIFGGVRWGWQAAELPYSSSSPTLPPELA